MSTNKSERNLSIITSRSVPIFSNDKDIKNAKIKSATIMTNRTNTQQSQEHLDNLSKIVDQTDDNLRQALEHAALRHEQLDQLHVRSQEMLNKNENLVFGITNYRKTQERDLFWRRFQYIAFGAITLGIIILLIILSITNKRAASSSQIIDIRQSKMDLINKTNNDLPSSLVISRSRRKRRRKREIRI